MLNTQEGVARRRCVALRSRFAQEGARKGHAKERRIISKHLLAALCKRRFRNTKVVKVRRAAKCQQARGRLLHTKGEAIESDDG